MPESHRFKAVLQEARGGGAGVMIPQNVAEAMGGRKQFRVIGTFNGVAMKTSTFPYEGEGLWLGVHKATREAAGVVFGDEVELEITRDDAPRTLELAPELEAALAAEPALRDRFEQLSFTRRRELTDPIAEARKPETRAARLEKALTALRDA
jgi:uncharacterized protein DUF1905/bacteriocin resistance YdeI/OmpD-like protein